MSCRNAFCFACGETQRRDTAESHSGAGPKRVSTEPWASLMFARSPEHVIPTPSAWAMPHLGGEEASEGKRACSDTLFVVHRASIHMVRAG